MRRVVADGHEAARHHVQLSEGGVPAGQAGGHGITPDQVHALRVYEEGQPAVTGGSRLLDALRAEGGDVDRDIGSLQVVDDLQRLP